MLLPVAALVLLFELRGPFPRLENIAFDSETWKHASTEPPGGTTRGQMLHSLERNHRLKGMTREQIRELLGEPCDDGPPNSEKRWHYDLGFCSGFQIDMDFLTFEFGDDGRVTGWWVWQS